MHQLKLNPYLFVTIINDGQLNIEGVSEWRKHLFPHPGPPRSVRPKSYIYTTSLVIQTKQKTLIFQIRHRDFGCAINYYIY